MSDAFDADVLIYASLGDPRAARALRALTSSEPAIGSILLMPETLTKPTRRGDQADILAVADLLIRIELKPVDEEIASAAVTLGAKYGLRTADAVHLATAVIWGADRFHTNNRRDFGSVTDEIDVIFGVDTT